MRINLPNRKLQGSQYSIRVRGKHILTVTLGTGQPDTFFFIFLPQPIQASFYKDIEFHTIR